MVRRGYWKELSNVQAEVEQWVVDHGEAGRMPCVRQLRATGANSLQFAIATYHGGFPAVAAGLRCPASFTSSPPSLLVESAARIASGHPALSPHSWVASSALQANEKWVVLCIPAAVCCWMLQICRSAGDDARFYSIQCIPPVSAAAPRMSPKLLSARLHRLSTQNQTKELGWEELRAYLLPLLKGGSAVADDRGSTTGCSAGGRCTMPTQVRPSALKRLGRSSF